MANIQSLSTELFQIIAAQLSVKDRKSLRFVNKRLCSQVTPLIFSGVVISNVPGSDRKIEMLKYIADPEGVAPWAHTATFHFSYCRDESESDVRKLLPSALKNFTRVQIFKLYMYSYIPDWTYDIVLSSLAELPHLTDLWIRAHRPNLPRSMCPPLPFHLLESLKTLRCIRISIGDVRGSQYAERVIFHPLRTFLCHSNVRDLTISLKTDVSDVQMPSIHEFLPEPGSSALQLENLELEGFITDMPLGLPPSLRDLKRLVMGPDSKLGNIWKCFETNRVQLQELVVSCDGSPFDKGLMSYLSSYSGLQVLHLNFWLLYSKPSRSPDLDRLRRDTAQALYNEVVPRQKTTLRVLTLTWPTRRWCLQPAYLNGLRSCENLEVLCVVVAQNDIVDRNILAELFEVAANMPKLGLLCLSVYVKSTVDIDNGGLKQRIRGTKIRAPSSREVTPLYLQLIKPDWVFRLRNVDDGWFFRFAPVLPRTIKPDSVHMIHL